MFEYLLKTSVDPLFRFWEGILILERIFRFWWRNFYKGFSHTYPGWYSGTLAMFTRGDFAANTGWIWFEEEFIDFCEGIFIKDFFIPSQGGTQGPLPCFTRGDFAANTGWDQGVMRFSAATGFFHSRLFLARSVR